MIVAWSPDGGALTWHTATAGKAFRPREIAVLERKSLRRVFMAKGLGIATLIMAVLAVIIPIYESIWVSSRRYWGSSWLG